VSLTDAGEKLLMRIRPAIMEMGAAVEDAKELRDTFTGTLRLNVSSIAAETRAYPGAQGIPGSVSRNHTRYHGG
jgi:DNA-binding transcriptional LysR family regulator